VLSEDLVRSHTPRWVLPDQETIIPPLDYPPSSSPSPVSLKPIFRRLPPFLPGYFPLALRSEARPGFTEVRLSLDPFSQTSGSRNLITGLQPQIPAHSVRISIGLFSLDSQPVEERARPLCIPLDNRHVAKRVAETLLVVHPSNSSSPMRCQPTAIFRRATPVFPWSPRPLKPRNRLVGTPEYEYKPTTLTSYQRLLKRLAP